MTAGELRRELEELEDNTPVLIRAVHGTVYPIKGTWRMPFYLSEDEGLPLFLEAAHPPKKKPLIWGTDHPF